MMYQKTIHYLKSAKTETISLTACLIYNSVNKYKSH